MKRIILLVLSLACLVTAVVVAARQPAQDSAMLSVGRSRLQATTVEKCGDALRALVEKYYVATGELEASDAPNAVSHSSAHIAVDMTEYINDEYYGYKLLYDRVGRVDMYLTDAAIYSVMQFDVFMSTKQGEGERSHFSETERLSAELFCQGEDVLIRLSVLDAASDSEFYGLFELFTTDSWVRLDELEDFTEMTLKLEELYNTSSTRLEAFRQYCEWMEDKAELFHPYLDNTDAFIQWASHLSDMDLAAVRELSRLGTVCRSVMDDSISVIEQIYDDYLDKIEYGMYEQRNQTYSLSELWMSGDEKEDRLSLTVDLTRAAYPSIRMAELSREVLINISAVDAVELADISTLEVEHVGSRLNIH